MNTIRALIFIFVSTAGSILATPLIFESAILGPTGNVGGMDISSGQYLGVRFDLSSETHITHVGGHLGELTSGGLFAAIVALPSSLGFPQFAPGNIETNSLASTVFSIGDFSSVDKLVALNTVLPQGNYALVFGSGAFGASGSGFMPTNGSVLGTPSFITGDFGAGGVWAEGSQNNLRFVVSAVPEPSSSIAMLGAASLLFALMRRRNLRKSVS